MADRSSPRTLGPGYVILLFGLVSFAGDIIYEGGRAIIPSYLKLLGLAAVSVGAILGGAEAIGYLMRLIAGSLVDKTRLYWIFIFLGYGLLVAIPLLGLFSSIWVAVFLVIIERIAKGIRAPSRDAVFSTLTEGVGVGKAFGVHEFMDQLGAVTGPLIVAFVLYRTDDAYDVAFLALFVPYALLVLVLGILYSITHQAFEESLKNETISSNEKTGFEKRRFAYYSLAVFLNTTFLLPMGLILYVSTSIVDAWLVPIIALLIQLVDAFAALIAGFLYDRLGIHILSVIFLLSIFPSLIVVNQSESALIAVSIVFGIVYGAQESVYRARITHFAQARKRGTAYGIFNVVYGLSLLFAGTLFGFLLDYRASFVTVVAVVTTFQLIAVFFLYWSERGG